MPVDESSMPGESPAAAVLVVDLDALARNYALLSTTVAPAECGAVVKANAYGLGLGPVATRLYDEGCRRFFVATAAEGCELRAVLPDARIYVFEGAVAGTQSWLTAAALTPVLNSLEQVERWARVGGPCALHLDTGMTRLGLSAADVAVLLERRELLGALGLEYLMTHLACADEPEHRLNAAQLATFDALRNRLPELATSIGNSAGAFVSAAYRGDLVRPGIALYGGNPFVARPSPVEPVVTLRGPILQLREITEAATVGYGASYAVAAPSKVAVVGLGYADGYPRSLSNCGVASVGGTRVPVIGRVSMDLLCLDVSAVPALHEGEAVELIGGAVSLDEVAATAGTISYEILTSIGPRVRREYRGLRGKAEQQ